MTRVEEEEEEEKEEREAVILTDLQMQLRSQNRRCVKTFRPCFPQS